MENFYAVIAAPILYDEKLTPRQKLLYAAITNMSNMKGYCFASNDHFSKMLTTSKDSIKRDLKKLEDRRFINRVVKVKPNGEIDYRAIYPLMPEEGVGALMHRGRCTDAPGVGAPMHHIITNNKNKNKTIKSDSLFEDVPLMKDYKITQELNHTNKDNYFALKLFDGFKGFYEDNRYLDLITVKEWIKPVKELMVPINGKPLYSEEEILNALNYNFNNKKDNKYLVKVENTYQLKQKIGTLIDQCK